jgi:hypothetical protein
MRNGWTVMVNDSEDTSTFERYQRAGEDTKADDKIGAKVWSVVLNLAVIQEQDLLDRFHRRREFLSQVKNYQLLINKYIGISSVDILTKTRPSLVTHVHDDSIVGKVKFLTFLFSATLRSQCVVAISIQIGGIQKNR